MRRLALFAALPLLGVALLAYAQEPAVPGPSPTDALPGSAVPADPLPPAVVSVPPLPVPDATKLYPLAVPDRGVYSLYVIRAIDGDTLDCAYLMPVRVRLAGINAPEHNQSGGPEATAYVAGLTEGKVIAAQLYGKEKYGRTLADFWMGEKRGWLAQDMIQSGHAKPYTGVGPRP